MSEYFRNIKTGAVTVATGLGITLKHFFNALNRKGDAGVDDVDYFRQVDGLVTLQYPREVIPTPKIGRYRLYNDIEDCIGCGQCERACPVSCITIETIKVAPDDLVVCGKTSDGQQKKFWIPVFDIDVAKCMTCGICTTVCPTECLVIATICSIISETLPISKQKPSDANLPKSRQRRRPKRKEKLRRYSRQLKKTENKRNS
jgi:NADH-quinone oxidoreductase subunit I